MRRSLVALSIAAILTLSACGTTPASTPPSSDSPAPTDAASQPPAIAAPLSGGIDFVYGAFAPQTKWEAYFAEFLAAHPDVTINYIPVSLDDGWGVYTQKIATLIAGGQNIDVIWTASEGVPPLADKGVLRSLDDLIAADAADPALQDYLADVSPALLDALKWDGKQFLMPFAWNNVVTWYNPKLFEADGVPVPAAGWTWDDYVRAATALTKDTDGDGQTDQFGAMADDGWFTVAPWLYSNDTGLLSEDLSTATVTDPKTIEVLTFLSGLVADQKVSPQPPAAVFDLFQAGKIAMFSAGRWPLETFRPADFADYEIAPMPAKVSSTTVIGSDGYGVTSDSDNVDASWALVKYLGGTEVMKNLLGVDAASGSIPARRSLAESAEMAPPANFDLFYGALDSARPVQAGVHFPEISSVFGRYMSQIYAGEMTVADAAAKMQEEMTVILAGG